ncbi:hypothetical protein HN801_02490, partial [Candidatus Peregrinibacteria bacterium]|nr:hypothetical protein [Candidatus Peregrinibacteria bacterium]
MKTKIIIGVLSIMAVAGVSVGTHQALTSQLAASDNFDCVGKVYGTPGCPMKSTEGFDEVVTVPPNCGDGIPDADEECDEGRFNGASFCSDTCLLYYCGDGDISLHIGEDCEPDTQEIYV